MNEPLRIKTISEFHEFMELPKPAHPLVSLTKFEDVRRECTAPFSRIMDLYSIAIKRNFHVKMKYGGEFADIDHLISAQTDHLFRGKVTTRFRSKLTTPNEALML